MKKTLLILMSSLLCLGFYGCSSDDDDAQKIELNSTNISMTHDQNFQLQYKSEEGNIFTFKSSNPLVADVNGSGLITGIAKGETIITVKDNKGGEATCKVNVHTIYSLFKEPSFDFGCSISAIKSYESRTILSENTTSIIYRGENANLTLLAYDFENSKYLGSMLLVPIECTQIVDFLVERYVPVDVTNGSYTFTDPTKKIIVGLEYSNDYDSWVIVYCGNTTSTKNNNINIKNIKDIISKSNVVLSK